MKHSLVKYRRVTGILCGVLLLAACANPTSGLKNTADKAEPAAADTAALTDSVQLLSAGRAVLNAFKEQDFKALSGFIHSDYGVRFSPYAYIDENKDILLSKDFIRSKNMLNDPVTWGNYDGSGEPILLTGPAYCRKFIYSADFLNAPVVSVNNCRAGGNSINNLTEAYSGLPYIEYYFPGFDPAYEGMDWQALRLVFRKENTVFYLVGVVHDQWTI